MLKELAEGQYLSIYFIAFLHIFLPVFFPHFEKWLSCLKKFVYIKCERKDCYRWCSFGLVGVLVS